MKRPAIVVVAALAAACTVGPNYKRPPVATPAAYRGETGVPSAASIADEHWSQVFTDPTLQGLITTALTRNDNVRLAAARILEAQARLGVTRADQFPTVSAGVDVLGQRPSVSLGFPSRNVAAVTATASVGWEIDFWGRYRRATEAARAQLLATEWGRRAVLTTLVAQVADAYFGLRALDLELDLSQRTLTSRQESLRLAQIREQGGATSMLDVRQAEQLVYGATGEIATLQRKIEQQENFISFLLGANPDPVTRGLALTEEPHAPELPAGVPSTLLERRPDIQQSEQQIVATNAQIGVARAAYFPNISLTGSGGFESTALGALFTASNTIWNAAFAAAEPVFTAGRTRSQVEIATAQREEAIVTYQQTVREAFREVADALVGYRKLREFREQQTLLVQSAEDARRLANIRYQGGATSYLEVLDSETRLFAAQLSLVEAQLNELEGYVELYRALGGGWQ